MKVVPAKCSKAIYFAHVIVLLLIGLYETSAQSFAPDNFKSTAQVIAKLCYVPGVKSEQLAWQFFACYDYAPGKEIFVNCQKRTFQGVLINSVQNIRNICSQPMKIPQYVRCLTQEFKRSGLDLNVSLRKVNPCELQVLSR